MKEELMFLQKMGIGTALVGLILILYLFSTFEIPAVRQGERHLRRSTHPVRFNFA